MKKRILFILLSAVIMALSSMVLMSCSGAGTPTITFNYSSSEGELNYGATGYLYGFSEEDVPDGDLLVPLQPKIAAVKAPGGEQHPVGDVLNVASTFIDNGGEALFIYLQDIYPEWYYVYRGQEDYYNKVDLMMQKLIESEYKDHFIYCPFNENDNGEWYGNFFWKKNRQKFYQDWIVIYKLIKSYDKNAVIAGPGFCSYKEKYVKEFMQYCKENDCLPDVIVWHELSDNSSVKYEENYKSYRKIEAKLGIDELPICISEYGSMSQNGVPGQMIKYIAMFERTKVDACIAYWRLANNLCETVADNTTPNSAWWLYYWYGQMRGNTYAMKISNTDGLSFNGMSSYDKLTGTITAIVGGESGETTIIFDNLNSLDGFDKNNISVSIEYIDYNGLGSDCYEPTLMSNVSNTKIEANRFEMTINTVETRAYRIILSSNEKENFTIENEAIRYEAEDAYINGTLVQNKANVSTYLVKKNTLTYASSSDLVNNIWENNAKLQYLVNIQEDGIYKLDICYGNGYKMDGTSSTRTYSKGVLLYGDSEEELLLENTISGETTALISKYIYLKKGEQYITIRKGDNGYGNSVYFDFIDITKINESSIEDINISYNGHFVREENGEKIFFIVLPNNGYFDVNYKSSNDKTLYSQTIYCQKGINILYVDSEIYNISATKNENNTVSVAAMSTFGNIREDKNDYSPTGKTINDVSREDNYIEWNINVEQSGIYALTIYYSNNEEIGEHSYNVQHVERYATIEINGDGNIYYFRNTFSWDTFKTKVIYVQLNEGDNVIKAYNDASYIWNGNIPYMPRIVLLEYCLYTI